jgi:apolipoprotein N-acyltransferase
MPIAALWGFLFGAASAGLTYPWLSSLGVGAFAGALLILGLQYCLFVLIFKFLTGAASIPGEIGALLLLPVAEYARSSGYLAFPFMVLGNTQAPNLCLSQSAALWGVWGISAAVAAPQIMLSGLIASTLGKKENTANPAKIRLWRLGAMGALSLSLLGLHLWGAWRLSLVVPSEGKADAQTLRVKILQPDFPARLSQNLPTQSYVDRVLNLAQAGGTQGLDLVVTPETAIPPSIVLHMESSESTADDQAIRSFMAALRGLGVDCLIGNDHGLYARGLDGEMDRLHFNSALLIQGGQVRDIYSKRRLVPFAEYFPFYRASPAIYNALRRGAGSLWTPGEGISLFTEKGIRFGTPICFEDCFGSSCRGFALAGADLLIDLSSDTWSASRVAMEQHLAMAALRAIEINRPILRVSNNGISAMIDPRGAASPLLPAFSRGEMTVSITLPQVERPTPYTRFGDALPPLCLVGLLACAGLVLAGKAPQTKGFIDKRAGI